MSIRKTLVRLSLIVSLPLAVVGLITSAAAAHGGDITIEASGSVSGTTVTYSVHMIWEDGHDVIGQGVVINASGPGGSRSATLSPTNSSGRTSGSIDLVEGTWSVTFNTDGGSRTISQRIGAEPVATAAPAPAPTAAPSPAPTAAPAPPTTRRAASGSTTTTRPGATTTSVAVADTTPTTVAVAAETTAVPDTSTTTASTSTSTTTSSIVVTEIASSSTKDDDGGSAGLIVALVVVALIAVGGGAAFWRRRVSAPAGASVDGPGE